MNASAEGKRRAFYQLYELQVYLEEHVLCSTWPVRREWRSIVSSQSSDHSHMNLASDPPRAHHWITWSSDDLCGVSGVTEERIVCVSRRFLSPDALMCRLYDPWRYGATSFNIFHLVLEVLWSPDVRVLVFVADVRSILWLCVGLRVTQLQTVIFSLKHSELSWIVSTTTGSIYV